jgi:hypothetical protein
MQYIVDGIVIDYPAEHDAWEITDTTTGQVAHTGDVTAIADIVAGFGGPDLRALAAGPYRDSGDEGPDA